MVIVTKKDGSPRFCVDYRGLNAVMKRDRWPMPCMEEIFDKINGSKEFLTTQLILMYPDYDKQFIVSTDASSKVLCAVLSQLEEDGREHPIQYASRMLNDAEKKYSTHKREALRMVLALKKFRHYILSQNFCYTLNTNRSSMSSM